MEEALLRDDAADEEGNQDDDRRGLPADPVELVDGRGKAEVLGMPDDPEQWPSRWLPACARNGSIPPDDLDHAIGITFERAGQPPSLGFPSSSRLVSLDVAQEPLVLFAQAGDTRMEARARSVADQALQKPGAVCVERLDAVHVDGNVAHARRLLHGLPDHGFKAGRVNGRPRTRGR